MKSFLLKSVIDILYIKCYKHKSCNEKEPNYLGMFHATWACFWCKLFCLYNDLKWMDYFWVFCKIDKWINNWFNYLEKFCFSAFCCGKKINCASRSCRFFLIEQVCFIFRVNLHSCNRVSWSSLSAFNNRKWNTSGK